MFLTRAPESGTDSVMAKKASPKRTAKSAAKRPAGRPPRAPDELRTERIVIPVTKSELEGYREDAGRKTLAEHGRDALELAHEARLERERRRGLPG